MVAFEGVLHDSSAFPQRAGSMTEVVTVCHPKNTSGSLSRRAPNGTACPFTGELTMEGEPARAAGAASKAVERASLTAGKARTGHVPHAIHPKRGNTLLESGPAVPDWPGKPKKSSP